MDLRWVCPSSAVPQKTPGIRPHLWWARQHWVMVGEEMIFSVFQQIKSVVLNQHTSYSSPEKPVSSIWPLASSGTWSLSKPAGFLVLIYDLISNQDQLLHIYWKKTTHITNGRQRHSIHRRQMVYISWKYPLNIIYKHICKAGMLYWEVRNWHGELKATFDANFFIAFCQRMNYSIIYNRICWDFL